MYLKSLELHGFKSFPNRTVLNFERGTTVVVGPNGSGKSNISDAMRWVLGELSSRNIRGTKMEDVIFGGTDDRRPMGFAEVSVTFDNTDKEHALNLPYDEVIVTRRYYRAGDSEYYINRKPCRLKDIYELFLNTGVGREGYSIIGQGRIAEILSKKSEDRRNFFEEAAGISKFRFKKQEAERKVAETENNMVRVRDILSMLEGRVGPLKRDAEKARKYLDLYEKKKRADVSLWLYDTKKLRADIEAMQDAVTLSEQELGRISESISTMEAQSDRLEEEQNRRRALSEDLMMRLQGVSRQVSALDSQYKLLESNIQHCMQTAEDCRRRMEEDDAAIAAQTEEQSGEADKATSFDEQIGELREQHLNLLNEQQKKAREIQEIDAELSEKLRESGDLESRAVDLRVRLDVLKTTQESGSDKSAGLDEEIARYEEEGEKLRVEAARCEKNAEGFKKKIAELDAIIQSGNAENEKAGEERALQMDGLSDLKVQQSSCLQRAETLRRMEEHFEGYNNSVRFIMQRYEQGDIRRAGKIHGPLSKLISVEAAYTTAIETALGANIQNIVVENEQTAQAAIEFLKENRAGRATFYPISAIRSPGETDEVRRAATFAGYVGRADQLVRFDAVYAGILEWLLVRTVVFDNLTNATNAARSLRYRVRIVTLDGQLINAGGSFTGGSAKHDSGIMSRGAQIEKLKQEADELTGRIAEAEKRIGQIDTDMKATRNRVQDAEQQKELLLTMSRAQFAALDSANAKLEANENLTAKLREDRAALSDSAERAGEETRELSAELAKLEKQIQAITDYRAERETAKYAIADERDALAEEATAVQVRIAETQGQKQTSLQRGEMLSARMEELRRDKVALEERIADQDRLVAQYRHEMQTNREEFARRSQEMTDIDSNRGEVTADNAESEKVLAELKQKIKEKYNSKDAATQKDSSIRLKLGKIENEYENLSKSLYEDYELTADAAKKLDYPPVTPENRSEFVSVQTECRQQIKSLGHINLEAIDEYDVVKDQYESLSTQVADLTHSYEEWKEIVARIEGEMKTGFVTAFAEINKNFGVVFRELFGGGQAELSLTDPEDVLNCGIEIKAAPPGKIIKSLALLSGGEQAFVACALFFAILKVNPTPFCLLDEIEAALDEVNVYRLGEYIKKFCGETQFILITHRRGTMQIADRLYGVTMPERGVSRVIALNVNELESKSKEFTDGLL